MLCWHGSDLLKKKESPFRRKQWYQRRVRGGVTEAQTNAAATLLTCLREVVRCTAIVGILGERYGWVVGQGGRSQQDKLLVKALEAASKEFPWVSGLMDRSVTEIEMRCVFFSSFLFFFSLYSPPPSLLLEYSPQWCVQGGGVMVIFSKKNRMVMEFKPEVSKWFYLRDPYFIEQIPKEERLVYQSEGEYEYKKLSDFKAELMKKQSVETYNRPSHLAELFLADLKFFVDQKFPPDQKLSFLDSERFKHNTFSRMKKQLYLTKENYYIELDKYVAKESRVSIPVVVRGDPGIGKSALLANWSARYIEHHPEDITIQIYIGCSSASTTYSGVLHRIMLELEDLLELMDVDIPDPENTVKLVHEFPRWILRVMSGEGKNKKLVLVIDGLNLLDKRDNSMDLVWFPSNFPKNVKVIVSCSPGECYDALCRRDYPVVKIESLEEGERKGFIRGYLNKLSKKLTEAQELKVAAQESCSNPRFLRVLLEDLSLFGDFESLDKRIDLDLAASDVSHLYGIVLDRIEKDYDKNNRGIVSTVMSFICTSRRGLYLDTELVPLMENKGFELGEWSSLIIVLEELLFNSGGLIKVSNEEVEKVVVQKYLDNSQKVLNYQEILVKFFWKFELNERKIDELPYHLEKSRSYTKLKECLTDMDWFDRLYLPSRKFDLISYWRTLESEGGVDVGEAYRTASRKTLRSDIVYRVGCFLEEIAKYSVCEDVLHLARRLYQNESQTLEVAKVDMTLGRVNFSLARYVEAEKLLLQSHDEFVKEEGEDGTRVAATLTLLGTLYIRTNDLNKAETCLSRALSIQERKLSEESSEVAVTLSAMGELYSLKGNFETAVEVSQKSLKILQDLFGPDSIQVSEILLKIGAVYMNQKEFTKSRDTLDRALKIVEKKYGSNHPNTADVLYALGSVHNVETDYDKAVEYYEKTLEIKRNAFGEDHPDVSRALNRLATVKVEQNKLQEAEGLFKSALEMREKQFGPEHSRVGQTLKHMITLYEMQEKWASALEVGNRALIILSKIFGETHFNIAALLARLGMLYGNPENKKYYDREAARKCLRRAYEIREAALGASHALTKQVADNLYDVEHPEEVAARERKRLQEQEQAEKENKANLFKRQKEGEAKKRTDKFEQVATPDLVAVLDSHQQKQVQECAEVSLVTQNYTEVP
eukprot:TRINITY_DN5103_c0_g2_i1.p1 TRINITY_DN5103_c0_g2~~TRINITY_DN5103_c0_g2_i1.p1  ORF type:complete len:1163 (+),score=289.74 TRINITY_DN5103_c0_g2_i1:174-3662(+)